MISVNKLKKIIKYLPFYPHYKMNVFSGTNSMQELSGMIHMLKTDPIIHGANEQEYVHILKEQLASSHIYTFASGRMGFYSILQAIDIQQDDEIIIPSFTCIVVPNAILYSGAKPIYCDIKADDFNIDVTKIEALINKKTKVLYAQHTFGQMCDIESIMNLAKKYNLIVVEDAALALGAKLGKKYAGTIGDFGYYSTDRSKVINTGLGGFVSVNNEKFVSRFEQGYTTIPYLDKQYTMKIVWTFIIDVLTLHPKIYWLGKFINAILTKLGQMTYFLDEPFTQKKQITRYPYPARLSNILAYLGISQINGLKMNLSHRKNSAKYYNDIFKIYTDDYIADEKNIFLRYSFLVNNRDDWEAKFSKSIDLSIWFKTIASGRINNFEIIHYHEGQNEISEFCTRHIFNLPTHNQIMPEKLRKLLLALKQSGDIITKKGIL